MDLSTPLIADACVRLKIELRIAPRGIQPIRPGQRAMGRALPVRHSGSIDVFLEALEGSAPGDVLVIDNDGRLDQGCIGDLTAIEAASAGVTGAIIWGAHRDTAELLEMEFALFSYGSFPAGPQTLRPRHNEALVSARFGQVLATRDDVVVADSDGVLFLEGSRLAEVLETAASIATIEREQAALVRRGTSLRRQLKFRDYLERRSADPAYSFRRHLREAGGAIEE